MPRKSLIVFILTVFMLTLVVGSAIASKSANGSKPKKLVNETFDGSENISAQYAPSFGPSMAPGQIMGMTIYEYQHNGTMGRQVAYWPGTEWVHFVWMKRGAVGGDRNIMYNTYNLNTSAFGHGVGMEGGKIISPVNGGYTTMDVTSGGVAVVSYHHGPAEDSYSPVGDIDSYPSGGLFSWAQAPGPPVTLTCEGWITGGWEDESNYIWPVVDWQDSAGQSIVHVVAAESPPTGAPNGEIQTIVYWRGREDGSTLAWPSCGTALDSIYNIAPAVRSDKRNSSGKVAITWMKPIYYDGDLADPCGYTQWQNDVVYIESTDYGVTWPRTGGGDLILTNITDYASLGPIEEQPNGQAYTDLSAMYDSDGKFHVVWATALRDVGGTTPCAPTNQSRIWHWDDGALGCVSIVYDASRPSIALDPGAWNLSACKMNISECIDGETSRMYVSFTRFGALTSANGDTNIDNSAANYANGDIFVTGSIDGGVTYGEAVNLTDSPSPDCAAGDCESDHWSSMSMYTDNATGLHIQYINDKDAGGTPQTEGVTTDNPVMYLGHPCFTPATYCAVGYTPTIVGYPLAIAPTTGVDCTIETTTSFDLNLTNVGNETTTYTLSSDVGWMNPTVPTGTLNAGCNSSVTVPIDILELPSEGVYDGQLTVSACGGAFSATINVQLVVACEFYLPENQILSTFCWSIGAWSVPRAGLSTADDKGNMYFYDDSATFMYDEGLIITMADDLTNTMFSCFDGSDSRVEFRAQGPLTYAIFPDEYEYTHGNWSNQDTSIVGEAEFWVPLHPDTCVLIERVKICNNEEVPITIHIGQGMDWDVADGNDGSNNAVAKDDARQEIYLSGPTDTIPEGDWYGTASTCSDIAGGIALENDVWIYPNGGYHPAEVGTLIANMTGFEATNPDTLQDMNSVYAIAQNVTLGVGECYIFCKVKAGSKLGLADLQAQIDKGKHWVATRELDCPGCQIGPGCIIGDANGSGGVDIDDVVYLIAYIFTGGPEPVASICCGDANGSGGVDIDDVVYLIAYIFTGGPEPEPEACNPPF